MRVPLTGLRIAVLLATAGAAGGCVTDTRGGPVQPGELADGWWEGSASSFPNSARVRVAVEDGRVVDVVLLEHGASWIGHDADEVIPTRIIEQQSTAVDAVTGATNSSHVIMNAVEQALERSRAAAAGRPFASPEAPRRDSEQPAQNR
jgi:uncharacterized protein with FMN-binding domain